LRRGSVSVENQAFVNDVLMTKAASYWMQALDVRRASAPLRVNRFCSSSVALAWGDGTKESTFTCMSDSAPTCGGHTIPSKFYSSRKVCSKRCSVGYSCGASCDWTASGCPSGCSQGTAIDYGSNHFLCEECTTEDAGEGAVGYDLYVFVTIADTASCGAATQAYAGSCVQDQCDRPIFGYINFCLSKLAEGESMMVATAIHEFAHILGFSSSLFRYFRHVDGSPKIPRDAQDDSIVQGEVKWTCTDNAVGAWPDSPGTNTYVDIADHGIVQTFSERGMTSCKCPLGGASMQTGCLVSSTGFRQPSCVVKMILPKVKEKAREHFDCSTLHGAELENQPTSSCTIVGSHWEERIFLNEVMAPVKVDVVKTYMSNVTLALFEDSGWYSPQYGMADTLVKGVHWGYKQGCSFASDSCLSSGATSFPRNWCTSGSNSCCYDRSGECACGTTTWTSALPSAFTYLSSNLVSGSLPETDYCPFYSTILSNRVCTSTSSIWDVASNANFMRENFAANSRCLESTLHGDYTDARGAVYPAASYDWSQPRSGCYEIVCKPGDASYDVLIAGESGLLLLGTCIASGQLLTSGSLQGAVTCAPPEVFCGLPVSRLHNFTVDPSRSSSYASPSTTPRESGLVGRAANTVFLLLPLACLSLHTLLIEMRRV